MNRRQFLQSSAATLGITAAGLDAALAAPKGPVSWKTLLEMSRIDVPTMANAIVSHAYCHIVEFGKPVTLGGLTVNSGDLLHADMHGVQQIPLDIAAQLPAAARQRREGEFDYIDFYRSPGFTVEKWRERNRKRG